MSDDLDRSWQRVRDDAESRADRELHTRDWTNQQIEALWMVLRDLALELSQKQTKERQ